jgi:hypothetical protein
MGRVSNSVRLRRHPLAVADVALALREAGERPEHHVLAVVRAYQPGSVT